ncbi:MAG: acylneuraminate cytidylyltransferase family protein [Verrucomicrobiota bacterium]
MIANRRILAVVPARSGSKGIPNKNLQLLGGKSLIARAGLTLKECPGVDRAIISTDSPDYAEEGKRHGLDAPFLRPPELSTDSAGAVETMIHALNAAEAHYRERYDIVLIIEPTCPFRRAEDIEGSIKLLIECRADSVVAVSKVDTKFHPHKILKIENERLTFFDATGAAVKQRQSLGTLYYRNGACYALTRQCLAEQKLIFSANTRAYVVDRLILNIDEPLELEFANYLIEKKGWY